MTEREMYIDIRLMELRDLLKNTDYIACKIAEGSATKEEYAEVIEQRQAWRREVNELETERDENRRSGKNG